MPRKLIKRYLPDHEKLRSHRHLRVFGTLLHDPNLWYLNRRSAAGAFAVGLFVAFVPLPLQMLIAGALAILLRVNLPVSVALVWVTNPVTMPPIFYSAYRLGVWVLGGVEHKASFAISTEWLSTELQIIWKPFLLGCFLMGSISALVGYFVIRVIWRLNLVRHYQRRKQTRTLRRNAKAGNEVRE